MDPHQCMIIDLEKRGDKQMFVTAFLLFTKIRMDFGLFGFRHHHAYSIIIHHVYFISHTLIQLISEKKDYTSIINILTM